MRAFIAYEVSISNPDADLPDEVYEAIAFLLVDYQPTELGNPPYDYKSSNN